MALNQNKTANRQKRARGAPEVQEFEDSLACPVYHQGSVGVYNQTHNWLYLIVIPP